MKNVKILILLLVLSITARGQETVQWASEVMFVTSEMTALQFSAGQVLHGPNVYPKGGESPNAWRPSKTSNQEYIVVKFEEPIRAQQIAIAETENPGAVSKVYAYDSLDNEYVLFELNPRPIPLASRLLNLFFEKTPYRIAYIRVDIDCSSVPGYNSIDAIGLSSSNIPISVLIELAPNVNENLHTEALSENVNSSYMEQSPLLSPDGKTLYFSRRGHPDNVGGVDDMEDIWYSELDEETHEWLPAQNLGAPLNTFGPNYICSITEVDGETILLLGNRYEKRGRMGEGISMTRKKPNGKWEKPKNIEMQNPYNYSDQADFYMSHDASIIIMSQERDDTNGDRDLYVSFENTVTEIWSEPLNLGSVINSADTEYAPFLDRDNETLYFSSRGFRGYGGSDIYVSKRLDDTWTNWSEPENMGRGVNGPQDDTYFNIPSSGSHAYFTRGSSNDNTDVYRFRIDELFVEPEVEVVDSTEHLALIDDIPAVLEPVFDGNEQLASLERTIEDPIYEEGIVEEEVIEEEPVIEEPIEEEPVVEEPVVEEVVEEIVEEVVEEVVEEEPIAEEVKPVPIRDVLITIHGRVFDSENEQPLVSEVVVERLPDGVQIGKTSTDKNGYFKFQLRPGARYGFMASKDGFLSKNEHVDLNDVTSSIEIDQNLFLSPIRSGAAVVLNNIFFDFDKSVLKTASYAELQRILDLLERNKINRIEISGHTDSIGDNEYNKGLSKRRANAVYSYFISRGIPESRMVAVGLGEDAPVAPNDTPDNRRKNRRVEFKILE